ncbi:basic proline-rich protein-like [Caloenas nicobarica]|uniref:basic proline-rich protein-like n=1 Tax=Caloenas nicobarica TaxID=187106 RepID=UPI0032B872D1
MRYVALPEPRPPAPSRGREPRGRARAPAPPEHTGPRGRSSGFAPAPRSPAGGRAPRRCPAPALAAQAARPDSTVAPGAAPQRSAAPLPPLVPQPRWPWPGSRAAAPGSPEHGGDGGCRAAPGEGSSAIARRPADRHPELLPARPAPGTAAAGTGSGHAAKLRERPAPPSRRWQPPPRERCAPAAAPPRRGAPGPPCRPASGRCRRCRCRRARQGSGTPRRRGAGSGAHRRPPGAPGPALSVPSRPRLRPRRCPAAGRCPPPARPRHPRGMSRDRFHGDPRPVGLGGRPARSRPPPLRRWVRGRAGPGCPGSGGRASGAGRRGGGGRARTCFPSRAGGGGQRAEAGPCPRRRVGHWALRAAVRRRRRRHWQRQPECEGESEPPPRGLAGAVVRQPPAGRRRAAPRTASPGVPRGQPCPRGGAVRSQPSPERERAGGEGGREGAPRPAQPAGGGAGGGRSRPGRGRAAPRSADGTSGRRGTVRRGGSRTHTPDPAPGHGRPHRGAALAPHRGRRMEEEEEAAGAGARSTPEHRLGARQRERWTGSAGSERGARQPRCPAPGAAAAGVPGHGAAEPGRDGGTGAELPVWPRQSPAAMALSVPLGPAPLRAGAAPGGGRGASPAPCVAPSGAARRFEVSLRPSSAAPGPAGPAVAAPPPRCPAPRPACSGPAASGEPPRTAPATDSRARGCAAPGPRTGLGDRRPPQRLGTAPLPVPGPCLSPAPVTGPAYTALGRAPAARPCPGRHRPAALFSVPLPETGSAACAVSPPAPRPGLSSAPSPDPAARQPHPLSPAPCARADPTASATFRCRPPG